MLYLIAYCARNPTRAEPLIAAPAERLPDFFSELRGRKAWRFPSAEDDRTTVEFANQRGLLMRLLPCFRSFDRGMIDELERQLCKWDDMPLGQGEAIEMHRADLAFAKEIKVGKWRQDMLKLFHELGAGLHMFA